MLATITLAESARLVDRDGVVQDVNVKRRYVNLLFALMAVHNLESHDEDEITFRRDDGYTFKVNLSVNHISFGQESEPEDDRLWDANVNIGVIERLLIAFIDGRDDQIRRHGWSG